MNSAPISPAREAETDMQSGNRNPGLQEQFEVKLEFVSVLPFKALFFYEPSIRMTEICGPRKAGVGTFEEMQSKVDIY